MDAIAKMPTYEAYKDSGVEWLGEVPADWTLRPLKHGAKIILGKMLCPTNKGGYFLKPYLKSKNIQWLEVDLNSIDEMWFSKKELELYRLQEGDLILSEGGEVGKTCIWKNELDECYVQNSAHIVRMDNDSDNRFFLYQFYSCGHYGFFDAIVNRVSIAHLTRDKLSNVVFVYPSHSEQTLIANFLDQKTAQIDEAIAIKEQQIVLLKERKQIIIQKAVTQGLDPDAPIKDSGVDWIGEIPAHWEVKRLKYVLEERNERSVTGEEPLFMVSQIHGLVVRADYHDKAEVAASNIDNKIVHKNDLVFNKLKAHLGVFFKSNIDYCGLVSPDYAVYKCKSHIEDAKYLELLFRHPSYIGQFIIRATGIVEGLIRLYTGDLFDMPVPIAPEQEQREILNFIERQGEKFDLALEIQLNQITKLKEYKTTLINSAVTGKIRITPEMLA